MLILWTMILLIRLQSPQIPILKLLHLSRLSTRLSKQITPEPKLQEPNLFDGSDTHKLHTFILQCKLNFRDCPDLFLVNTAKVNYIFSYLKGSTLDCFKPTLLDLNKPDWLLDIQLFIKELKTNFGTYDPVSEVEAEL